MPALFLMPGRRRCSRYRLHAVLQPVRVAARRGRGGHLHRPGKLRQPACPILSSGRPSAARCISLWYPLASSWCWDWPWPSSSRASAGWRFLRTSLIIRGPFRHSQRHHVALDLQCRLRRPQRPAQPTRDHSQVHPLAHHAECRHEPGDHGGCLAQPSRSLPLHPRRPRWPTLPLTRRSGRGGWRHGLQRFLLISDHATASACHPGRADQMPPHRGGLRAFDIIYVINERRTGIWHGHHLVLTYLETFSYGTCGPRRRRSPSVISLFTMVTSFL